jgi:hypothetical protein
MASLTAEPGYTLSYDDRCTDSDCLRGLRGHRGSSRSALTAVSASLFGDASDRCRQRSEPASKPANAGRGCWEERRQDRTVAALTVTAPRSAGLSLVREPPGYDVPREAPLLRFLDTRVLGEANYDPLSDISWCEGQSHLVLVVMQVSDPLQRVVLDALQQARRHHPGWPVVVAQTGLHRLYPLGRGHPTPYPYAGAADDETQASLPQPLRQALAYQRKLFDGLPGPRPHFVPVDFTVPEDGYPPHDYGLDCGAF